MPVWAVVLLVIAGVAVGAVLALIIAFVQFSKGMRW